MSQHLRFSFDPAKLAQVLAFFAHHRVPDLTKLKAAKLLFFADKAHLTRFGRPIVGDWYVAMDNGPVPSQALDIMNSLISPDEVEDPVLDQVARILHVRKWFGHPRIEARRNQLRLDVFSKSELDVLNEVVDTYGSLSAGELIDLSHRDPAWRRADKTRLPHSAAPMYYEWFWDDLGDEPQAVRQLAEAEQDDRDFVAALRRQ